MWYDQRYESIFNRFARARLGCPRAWSVSSRADRAVSGLSGQYHSLASTAARVGRSDPTHATWSRSLHSRRAGNRVTPPIGGCSRRVACCPRRAMGCRLRHVIEHLDDGASHPPYRLVAQKKSLIASERDPWLRAVFALEQAELDATKLVVIDEVGSNLDLTPTHAWAPVGQRALASAPRNTPLNTSTIASLTH